ncbi:MAG TPA: hypothetical protein VER79_14295, partial [Candidatus Limnocylindrales bacterium]|nr:hypothetical protein [Candidatus Limnocylindrales bacterium]
DSEMFYTRAFDPSSAALLQSILLPQRSLYTLVARGQPQPVIGQFRMRAHDHLAQLVLLAPLDLNADDGAWLGLLDAVAYEAGRRGAHMLTAEVDEMSPLFPLMRQAGFAVYARQEIWRWSGELPGGSARAPKGELAEETDEDTLDIQLLYSSIVPRLVQPIAVPSRESGGLVYRKDGHVQAYIALSTGRAGTYLMPFIHPEVLGSEAAAVLLAVIAHVARAEQLPVYVCVRRYQDWLGDSLRDLGFETLTQQAVLVRHIAAGVRSASFSPLFHLADSFVGVTNTIASRLSKLSFASHTGENSSGNGTPNHRRSTGTETGAAAVHHGAPGRNRE